MRRSWPVLASLTWRRCTLVSFPSRCEWLQCQSLVVGLSQGLGAAVVVVVVVPLVCGSLPRLQRLGHPGVAWWVVVVAVGAVCFLLVGGRRVVVVCQALPCCRRVGCVVLV